MSFLHDTCTASSYSTVSSTISFLCTPSLTECTSSVKWRRRGKVKGRMTEEQSSNLNEQIIAHEHSRSENDCHSCTLIVTSSYHSLRMNGVTITMENAYPMSPLRSTMVVFTKSLIECLRYSIRMKSDTGFTDRDPFEDTSPTSVSLLKDWTYKVKNMKNSVGIRLAPLEGTAGPNVFEIDRWRPHTFTCLSVISYCMRCRSSEVIFAVKCR